MGKKGKKNPTEIVDTKILVTTTIQNVKKSEFFNAVFAHDHDKIAVI